MTQHAYSVTGLARVRGPAGETPLVRLRNPSGQGEWTGAWSERSWEWDGLSARDKELLSMRVRNDGEFWYVNQIELPTIIGSIYLSIPACVVCVCTGTFILLYRASRVERKGRSLSVYIRAILSFWSFAAILIPSVKQ